MMREFRVWYLLTTISFQQVLLNKPIMMVLLLGKSLRIILFLIFFYFLFQGTESLAGYSKFQIIFFYLSFNLIDTLAQVFFREVYRFRRLVITGSLDYVLLKPINPLIRILLGGTDLMDLIIFLLLLTGTIVYGSLYISMNSQQWLLYSALLCNGLLISAALHIIVLGLGIMTTTVDHLVMVYRDLTSLMRIPVDVYVEPLRSLLTFVIPLGIMITFPPKALMGLVSIELVIISIAIGCLSLTGALWFWRYSLQFYQGASS
jgi:ABC-2 type transport system permease protein